jgi:hypothetical protein
MFLRKELVSQQLKIFDHPIVDESELSGPINMGMRILIGHRPVGSPAGVP